MGRKRKNKYTSTPTSSSIKLEDAKRKQEEKMRQREEEMRRLEEERQREIERRRLEEEERRLQEELRREEERRKEEELRKQMEEERMRREAEEREERKRRIEEQVRRKMEEEKRKTEERKRAAEERRRKLEEEERLRAEEEKTIREDLAQKELERRLKTNMKEQVHGDSTFEDFDLLGGIESDEEVSYEDNRDHHRVNSSSKESSVSSVSNTRKYHRDLPQRGEIDRIADTTLDDFDLLVPIKKQGRTDGVYLFGGRIMKIKLSNGQPVVQYGSKMLSIEDYLFRFESVEETRLRGLQSAFQICTFLGAKSRKSPAIKV